MRRPATAKGSLHPPNQGTAKGGGSWGWMGSAVPFSAASRLQSALARSIAAVLIEAWRRLWRLGLDCGAAQQSFLVHSVDVGVEGGILLLLLLLLAAMDDRSTKRACAYLHLNHLTKLPRISHKTNQPKTQEPLPRESHRVQDPPLRGRRRRWVSAWKAGWIDRFKGDKRTDGPIFALLPT